MQTWTCHSYATESGQTQHDFFIGEFYLRYHQGLTLDFTTCIQREACQKRILFLTSGGTCGGVDLNQLRWRGFDMRLLLPPQRRLHTNRQPAQKPSNFVSSTSLALSYCAHFFWLDPDGFMILLIRVFPIWLVGRSKTSQSVDGFKKSHYRFSVMKLCARPQRLDPHSRTRGGGS